MKTPFSCYGKLTDIDIKTNDEILLIDLMLCLDNLIPRVLSKKIVGKYETFRKYVMNDLLEGVDDNANNNQRLWL